MTAVTPADADHRRTETIRDYNLTDKPPEIDLQAVVKLAAGIAGAPIAAVNLIDEVNQYTVATEGFAPMTVPRCLSMCEHALEVDESIYVPDARLDPRFADNPLVNGDFAAVRLYHASQLRTPDGLVVGTLCIFDTKTRTLELGQRQALDDLASGVSVWLDLRRRHAELELTVGELKRSNADLSAFAGRIAHDLRNPLTALSGFLTLADRRFGEEMSDRLRTIIRTALEAADRMAGMLEDMLAFASIGAAPVLHQVSLAAIAAAVSTDCAAAIAAAGAELQIADLPTVTTDETLVWTLLQNLVANSTKFRRPDVDPLIVISGSRDLDGSWTLVVADNGRGIPEAERVKVFEPFARASNSAGTSGTGIGLATCDRVAERLGGRLEFSETSGGGATFTLSLPPS